MNSSIEFACAELIAFLDAVFEAIDARLFSISDATLEVAEFATVGAVVHHLKDCFNFETLHLEFAARFTIALHLIHHEHFLVSS